MLRVVISLPAERDLREQFQWWAEHRSLEQARRWFSGFRRAIDALATSHDRCVKAPENGRWPFEVRQLTFGLGRTPSHRAVFRLDGDKVVVLRTRHLAQDDLRLGDIDV
jgi:plasmid stabilization system protein ParE